MVRVFLLVYWLASEALPMLKIYTLARLISLLQFRDTYSIKYDDGFEYNQPCERSTYGTGLGKEWCIIQPIS